MSAFTKIFNLLKDTDKASNHTITVQTRHHTIFRYLLSTMVFIVVLQMVMYYIARGENIQCYEVDCDEDSDNDRTDEDCQRKAFDQNANELCRQEVDMDPYECFPTIMIIITLIMFITAKFEVSQYRQKEHQFLKIVNTHFDPYHKGALQDLQRILRKNVLKHQQSARDHLFYFSGEMTLYKSDVIRYIMGCVVALMAAAVYLGLGIYMIYITAFSGYIFTCPYFNPTAECKLPNLTTYKTTAFVLGALCMVYFSTSLQYWTRITNNRVVTEIKTLGTEKSAIFLNPPDTKEVFKSCSYRHKPICHSRDNKTSTTEISHMVSKLCIANEPDVVIYTLANFYPNFENAWKVPTITIKEKTCAKPGKRKIRVTWENASVFKENKSSEYFHSPRYEVYCYDQTKMVERKEEDPMNHLSPFSVDFDGLIPGTEYTVAVCTKLGSYFISVNVKKETLLPPKPTLDITEISDTYVDVGWIQLPQAYYQIVGYKLEVVKPQNYMVVGEVGVNNRNSVQVAVWDTKASFCKKAALTQRQSSSITEEKDHALDFDPLGDYTYTHRIKNLIPDQEYVIRLIAQTKGSSSVVEQHIKTREVLDDAETVGHINYEEYVLV